MTAPILYSFRRCPYAMRARMALLVGGAAFDRVEVKLCDKPAALLAASPKGTVPVLVLPDGRVIDESLDIMRHALATNDPEHWLAGDDTSLIAANDGPFKHHLDRYKYPDRHDSNAPEHRAAGLVLLGVLETRLAGMTNLCGNTCSLTDIALIPFVRQFAAVDRNWFAAQDIPQVQRWLAMHVASDVFVMAMVKLEPIKSVSHPNLVLPPAREKNG